MIGAQLDVICLTAFPPTTWGNLICNSLALIKTWATHHTHFKMLPSHFNQPVPQGNMSMLTNGESQKTLIHSDPPRGIAH